MIINGKEAKFFWGMIAYEVYRDTIIGSKQKLSAFSVKSVAAILWGGILNHYERLCEDCPFKFAEVYDHVESKALEGIEDAEITKCVTDFNNSAALQSAAKQLNETDKKKAENSETKNSES